MTMVKRQGWRMMMTEGLALSCHVLRLLEDADDGEEEEEEVEVEKAVDVVGHTM